MRDYFFAPGADPSTSWLQPTATQTQQTMNGDEQEESTEQPVVVAIALTSQSIDWYSEGQSRTVEIDGVQIIVRFIGRKGRRGRIAIEAPAGAVFTARDRFECKG